MFSSGQISMWKVLILFVYLTIEALVVVSFENSNVSVEGAQKYSGSGNDVASYRLPNTTIPQMYSVGLTFRDDVSFLGSVNIKINILENTNVITLHSSVLILNTSLTKSDMHGKAVAHTHDIDVEREFLLIKTTEEILQKDSIMWLTVNYIGYISTSNEGVFRKSFKKSNGDIRYKYSSCMIINLKFNLIILLNCQLLYCNSDETKLCSKDFSIV